MSRLPRWPPAIVLSSVVLDVLVATGVGGPLRLTATLWFLLVCTGMSFVPLLPIAGRDAQLAIGVALSLAIDAVATTTILVAGGFSMVIGLALLELICLMGCAAQLRRWMVGRPVFSLRLYP